MRPKCVYQSVTDDWRGQRVAAKVSIIAWTTPQKGCKGTTNHYPYNIFLRPSKELDFHTNLVVLMVSVVPDLCGKL